MHAGNLMGWQVVHNDDVARLQVGHQGLGDVAVEARAVRGTVQKRGRAQPARAQGGRDGHCFVSPLWGCKPAALAARGPAMTPRHFGGSRRLVQEHKSVRIELGLGLEQRLARRAYVRALLLSCVRRPLFEVIACYRKKRDRPLVLV